MRLTKLAMLLLAFSCVQSAQSLAQPHSLATKKAENNVKSAKNTKADKNAKSAKSTKADKDTKSAKSTKADKDAKSAKSTKADKDTKSAKSAKADKDAKSAKSTKADKDTKSAKSTKADKDAKSAKNTKADKAVKSAKNVKLDKKSKSHKNFQVEKNLKVTKQTKTEKNETERLYGVKGANLKPTKVSNKCYSYVEKGKMHTTIDKETSRQYGQIGIASYYAGDFHGRKTANGEIFDKNAYTAAHKTLALGSYALVTNLHNGRKVVVKINDRGPFSKSRIIDLSKGAARELRMINSGVARVKVEAIQVDKQGYISGKGVNSLQKIAQQDGLPLKTKGIGKNLAIKADPKTTITNDQHKITTLSRQNSQPKSLFGLKVLVKTATEAKKISTQVKQKTTITSSANGYAVVIPTNNVAESLKVRKQLQKLSHHQIITYSEK